MFGLYLLIERKRAEMYEAIDTYGISDFRTVKKSKELDKLVAIEQRRKSCVVGASYLNVSAVK